MNNFPASEPTLSTLIGIRDLEQYLHDHIPISKALGVEVVEALADSVRLFAPLAPNINHRDTVFAGSASAVAILSAWSLLYIRLKEVGVNTRLVLQRNSMCIEHPILTGFTATAAIESSALWDHFLDMLTRKHKARIHVTSELFCNGERVGELEADFVAIAMQPA